MPRKPDSEGFVVDIKTKLPSSEWKQLEGSLEPRRYLRGPITDRIIDWFFLGVAVGALWFYLIWRFTLKE